MQSHECSERRFLMIECTAACILLLRQGTGEYNVQSWDHFGKTSSVIIVSVAIVSELENNSHTCKLHLQKFYSVKGTVVLLVL